MQINKLLLVAGLLLSLTTFNAVAGVPSLYGAAGSNGNSLFAYDTNSGDVSNLGSPFYVNYGGAVSALALSSTGILYGAAGSNGNSLFAYDTNSGAVSNLGSPFYVNYGAVSALAISTLADPVPVPAAAWLFGSALLGLLGFKRRRGANSHN